MPCSRSGARRTDSSSALFPSRICRGPPYCVGKTAVIGILAQQPRGAAPHPIGRLPGVLLEQPAEIESVVVSSELCRRLDCEAGRQRFVRTLKPLPLLILLRRKPHVAAECAGEIVAIERRLIKNSVDMTAVDDLI